MSALVRRPSQYELINSSYHDSELTIFDAELRCHVLEEVAKIRINTQVAVVGHAANAEMETLDELTEKAGLSGAKQQLAASWTSRLHRLNTSTVDRAF